MKKLLFPFLMICLTAIQACQKETVTLADSTSVARAMSEDYATASGTKFGALVSGGTTDDKIKVLNKFNVSYVRMRFVVNNFNKSSAFDKYERNGFKVILNLNYGESGSAFPTDMVKYKKLLANILDKYKPEVAVIENEPTVDKFHKGPIEDYITELKAAVEVCKARNIKVTDGGIHPDYILQVKRGTAVSGNALEVKKLISAYKTINLDYVNIHTNGQGDSYPKGQLEEVATYIKAQTGKPVMSNEFNVRSTSSNLVKDMVAGFKAGGYVYTLVRSGEGEGGAKPLHKGTSLLSNGITYRDEIKK